MRYFRYKPSSLEAIESGLFLTPLDDCGVDIKSKGIYYLCGTALGPNAWVSACDYNKKFENLSFSERIFFIGGYKKVNCFDQELEQPKPFVQLRQSKPPDLVTAPPRIGVRPQLEGPTRRPPETLQLFPMFGNFSTNHRPDDKKNEKNKEKKPPNRENLYKDDLEFPSLPEVPIIEDVAPPVLDFEEDVLKESKRKPEVSKPEWSESEMKFPRPRLRIVIESRR